MFIKAYLVMIITAISYMEQHCNIQQCKQMQFGYIIMWLSKLLSVMFKIAIGHYLSYEAKTITFSCYGGVVLVIESMLIAHSMGRSNLSPSQ